MSTPVALYLQDAHPIREGMDIVRYAEQRGFDAVWQAESRLVREATVPMAAFASVTERIKVGSGVVDCWSRNPARLAATFSTLDDLAPGRVILGIGAWWDPLAKKVGIDRARPLTVMREIVTVVRALLHNENVTFDGAYVHLDGVELDYVYQERRPKDVPIYLGATGLQMMELAGEIADGRVEDQQRREGRRAAAECVNGTAVAFVSLLVLPREVAVARGRLEDELRRGRHHGAAADFRIQQAARSERDVADDFSFDTLTWEASQQAIELVALIKFGSHSARLPIRRRQQYLPVQSLQSPPARNQLTR